MKLIHYENFLLGASLKAWDEDKNTDAELMSVVSVLADCYLSNACFIFF